MKKHPAFVLVCASLVIIGVFVYAYIFSSYQPSANVIIYGKQGNEFQINNLFRINLLDITRTDTDVSFLISLENISNTSQQISSSQDFSLITIDQVIMEEDQAKEGNTFPFTLNASRTALFTVIYKIPSDHTTYLFFFYPYVYTNTEIEWTWGA